MGYSNMIFKKKHLWNGLEFNVYSKLFFLGNTRNRDYSKAPRLPAFLSWFHSCQRQRWNVNVLLRWKRNQQLRRLRSSDVDDFMDQCLAVINVNCLHSMQRKLLIILRFLNFIIKGIYILKIQIYPNLRI